MLHVLTHFCPTLRCSDLEKAADAAAVEAMRAAFNDLEIDGTVVIGEGERDEAPMLYIGEKVGNAIGQGPRIDIALDPLEGTTITAKADPNRSEEHTSELQSLMRTSNAVFCLKNKN